MQKMVKPIRLVVLAVVFVLLLGVYFVALYKLQIIGGREYYAVGETETKEDITIAAARGNILDRYGRLLVSNSLCNNLSINVTELFSQDDPNAVILELCSAVERFGDTYTDTLPITKAPPFEFTEMDTLQKSMLDAWLKANDMPLDSSAVEILAAMRTRYSVGSEYNAEDARRIVGVRYEINDRFNINTTPYVFAEDVSMPLLTYLMEQDIPGFELSSSYVREYKTQYAAHLLGYTGKLTAEEWATYAGKDYSLDAYVGKDGVEYAFEEYLHGVDGEAEVYSNLDGVTLRTKYTKEPQPGGHVYLTLDIGLQEVCEEALAAHIESINEDRARIIAEAEMYGTESTEMISGGALCVVKVDTGEPLALVSYPTYDAATMLENYETLVADENAPLYNRALMGVYAPGSTFKPCTATALLAEGIISPTRTLKTEGQFTKYIDDGYAPECWIYSTYKYTHGEINVVQAITYSCNYFFYTVGSRLYEHTDDQLYKTAALYGLTTKTGIDLPGELQGYVASQTTLYDKNKAISAAEQSTWRPSIVFNNIKKHLVDVGEKYNMTFDEEKLNKCVKRLMDMAVDYNQNDWLPEIRTILMEELDMPRELVYLQIVAGDTFIMLNEIKWGGSEAIMAAVGQSITTVTPVEMARYVAAVANGGKVYDLQLIDSIISPDGEVLSESTPILASEIEGEGVQEYLAALRKGMSGVTGDDGTAAKFYKGEYADVGAKMGAKTGTAEKTTIDLENNAWMVAFAPFDDPQIAVCVYIPHGYSGSYCSITIREVLNYYLEHMGLDGEDTMPPSNSLAY